VQLPLERLMDAEIGLANRLHEQGVNVGAIFDGRTEPTHRRETIRKLILLNALSQVIVWKHAAHCETFAAAFHRMYGQHL
jgi:hypothetical protein